MNPSGGHTSRVVVGVDGSPASYEALRWAVRQARLMGATVDAVAAYDVPGGVGWSAPAVDADFDEAQARQTLADEIRSVLVQVGEVPLTEHVVRGHAAKVLLGLVRRRAAGGGQQGAGRLRPPAAGIGQPAMRPARLLPRRHHPPGHDPR